MLLIATHFQRGGDDPRFAELLQNWLTCAMNVAPSAELCILTDRTTSIGREVIAMSDAVFRQTAAPSIVRPQSEPGSAFDYKAALICSLLESGELNPFAHVGIFDTDATLHRSPFRVFDELQSRRRDFAMPRDPGERPLPGNYGVEQSSCALFFPSSNDVSRKTIARLYCEAWRELKGCAEEYKNPLHVQLREQRAWSVVLNSASGTELLGNEYAWSPRCWGPPPDDVVCIHRHGSQKWEH